MTTEFALSRVERTYGQRLEIGVYIEWPFQTGRVWKVVGVNRENDRLEMESYP